jgi:membrane carboxypeptidase/penicillin-binding protein PbpC
MRAPDAGFHIVSPREGDVYRLSPGVEPRYATVALRAAGGGAAVRWTVDGAPHAPGRWSLQPGRHRLRAVSASGDSAEVTVRVE